MKNSFSNSQIDEAILSVAIARWSKVALVIHKASQLLGDKLPEGDAGLDLIEKRIEALVQNGLLLAQGNVKKWFYSEVRKPN